MRQFSSYGPVNTKLHYYVPREALIEEAYTQLMGENPDEGGHYITVWAPRQRGKSWVMQQTLYRLQKEERFDTIAPFEMKIHCNPLLLRMLYYNLKFLLKTLTSQ